MRTARPASKPPSPACLPKRSSGARSRASGRRTRWSCTVRIPRPTRPLAFATWWRRGIPWSWATTRRSGRAVSTTTRIPSPPPSPSWTRCVRTPSLCCAASPKRRGSAWADTRSRAATGRRTGSPSTRSISRCTRARSRPTWRPGAPALLSGGGPDVPAAEVRRHLDGLPLLVVVVEQRAARDVIELEARPLAAVDRDGTPLPIHSPLRHDGAIGIDGEVVELRRAQAHRDRPLPLAHERPDGVEPLRRGRGAAREEGGEEEHGARASGAGHHRTGLCQSACPTKKGPRLAMYSEVWTVLRMACTRCDRC